MEAPHKEVIFIPWYSETEAYSNTYQSKPPFTDTTCMTLYQHQHLNYDLGVNPLMAGVGLNEPWGVGRNAAPERFLLTASTDYSKGKCVNLFSRTYRALLSLQ